MTCVILADGDTVCWRSLERRSALRIFSQVLSLPGLSGEDDAPEARC